MVKDDGYNISETGNWNVAADYSKVKLMKHLYLADEYAEIAKFGHSTMFEEIQIQYPTDDLRMKGIMRLLNTLVTIIDNAEFAIKNPGDKKKLISYRENLKRIEKIFPKCFKVTTNKERMSKLTIDNEKFMNVLEKILELKRAINTPLNKSDLIYIIKKEFDPKKYKKRVLEDAITRG